MKTIYLIMETYEIDNTPGDPLYSEDPVIAFENNIDAIKYLKEVSKYKNNDSGYYNDYYIRELDLYTTDPS